MNPFPSIPNDPDDPRITAYALGELDEPEAGQVARAVAADPVLQAAVQEIRATAGRVTAALQAEPLPQPVRPVHFESYHPVRPARIFRLPYWSVAAMAAAACVAMVLFLRRASPPSPETIAMVGQTGGPEKAAKAGAMQTAAPNDRVTIIFPKPDEEAGLPAVPGLPAEAKGHLGFVVPAAPEAAALPAPSVNGGAPNAAYSAHESRLAAQKPESWGTTMPALAGAVALPAPPQAPSLAYATPGGPSTAGGFYGYEHVRPAVRPDVIYGTLQYAPPPPPFDTEAYDYLPEHGFLAVAEHPLSTFSVDVDTASYSNVRRFLLADTRPPRDAVRIEEMVNYFSYAYAPPPPSDPNPIAASLEVASAPWAPTHRLVRIGLKARELPAVARGPANLVFLIDVSGSMGEPAKLPLVKEAMRMLVGRLRPDDRVAIVTYAGTSGLALPSTPASDRRTILDAIDQLSAGGSTNGAVGIQLAYDVAKAHYIANGVNRVILATDGDFNVGVTDRGDLVRLIEKEAKTGVFLTALGVGTGNYKDATLEQLADHGNGTYAYLDSAREARRVLEEQLNGTLATVAKDVKVQVEFNPARVQAYRLIGYDDRRLRKEDFNNDRVDAGEMGAGQTVTALYEVIPVGVAWKPESTVDALKYQKPEDRGQKAVGGKTGDELLTVKVRYKAPSGSASKRLESPLVDRGETFAQASPDFKFAAAVAGFGMILRDSRYAGDATLKKIEQWAGEGIGSDAGGYRGEFLSLVKRAGEVLPSQG